LLLLLLSLRVHSTILPLLHLVRLVLLVLLLLQSLVARVTYRIYVAVVARGGHAAVLHAVAAAVVLVVDALHLGEVDGEEQELDAGPLAPGDAILRHRQLLHVEHHVHRLSVNGSLGHVSCRLRSLLQQRLGADNASAVGHLLDQVLDLEHEIGLEGEVVDV
ncbi:hypothetical protein PENTCL1PPCAC_25913, partial [Pristionchus entomophagus]